MYRGSTWAESQGRTVSWAEPRSRAGPRPAGDDRSARRCTTSRIRKCRRPARHSQTGRIRFWSRATACNQFPDRQPTAKPSTPIELDALGAACPRVRVKRASASVGRFQAPGKIRGGIPPAALARPDRHHCGRPVALDRGRVTMVGGRPEHASAIRMRKRPVEMSTQHDHLEREGRTEHARGREVVGQDVDGFDGRPGKIAHSWVRRPGLGPRRSGKIPVRLIRSAALVGLAAASP